MLDPQGNLLAVASWRSAGPCGSGTSVFTRVDAHRDFIASTLAN